MREPLRDNERLRHILNAISRVEEFTQGLDKDTLNADILHLHATVYNIQIVGEAVYKLSLEFKEKHPETPWRIIEKMRHILVHDYYQVNKDILWMVMTDDLPVLKQQVEGYLRENDI